MNGGTGRLIRRFSLASLAVAAFAAFALASAPTAAAQETLAASCEPPEEDINEEDSDPVAQNFTAQASGNLTRAEVSLVRDAGTEEDFTVQIWTADANGDPVTLLSTGTIDADNVPVATVPVEADDPAPVGVVFGTAAPIVAGQSYAIVISREAIDWWVGTRDNEDCQGELREANLVTGEWVLQGEDLVYRVFVTPPGAAVTCRGEPVTIVGTSVNDTITGTNGRDVIAALGGNDEVIALDGNDVVCGNVGSDKLRGQDGADRMKGNRGSDRVKGASGDDKLKGNRGEDTLKGKSGDDVLNGGRNDDTCRGGGGDNKIRNCES
jgi:Ca2+-binding RTX toxin-like protein